MFRYLVVKLTAWMQIGLSLIAVLVGAFFIAASMTGTRLDPLEKSLAFAFTGLPSFLLLFLLSVQFSISFWTKNHRKKLIPDIDVLRQRLFGLSEGIRIRMETSEVVGFAVGLNSAVVYARKGRKKRMIVVGDQFLRNATDEEVEGIVAHELVHIHQRSLRRVMSIVASELFVVQLILIFIPQVFIVLGTLFGVTRLIMLPVCWRLEYDADRRAAEKMGAELIDEALKRLSGTNFVGTSLTHPPLSRRLARLQSLGMRTDSKN